MTQNIHLRVSTEKKSEIKAQAKHEGLTITAFILASVNDRINRNTNGEI